MTEEEFAEAVVVRIVVDDDDTLERRLWLYTHGLAAHGLPELEMRDVHPFWAYAAFSALNHWGSLFASSPVQARSQPITIDTLDGIYVTARLESSKHPHWAEHATGCLAIVLRSLELGCSVCDEHGSAPGTVH